jgi:hypothetical protein
MQGCPGWMQLDTHMKFALHTSPPQHPAPPGHEPPGIQPPSGQHCTACPQLSTHVELHPPLGVQHCPLEPQTWPDPQPHIIVPPHAFETVPHATPLHEAGEQQSPLGSQTWEPLQFGGHCTVC